MPADTIQPIAAETPHAILVDYQDYH